MEKRDKKKIYLMILKIIFVKRYFLVRFFKLPQLNAFV